MAARCHERCQNAVPALELEGELQGRLRVLPESVVCVRFGAGLLVCRVPLQGAASGCCQSDACALELACWCSQSNVCALELALLVPLPLQGAASCWCRSVACAVELGCWRRSRALLLWNLGAGAVAGGRCEISMAVGDYIYPVPKRKVFGCCLRISCAIWVYVGVFFLMFDVEHCSFVDAARVSMRMDVGD